MNYNFKTIRLSFLLIAMPLSFTATSCSIGQTVGVFSESSAKKMETAMSRIKPSDKEGYATKEVLDGLESAFDNQQKLFDSDTFAKGYSKLSKDSQHFFIHDFKKASTETTKNLKEYKNKTIKLSQLSNAFDPIAKLKLPQDVEDLLGLSTGSIQINAWKLAMDTSEAMGNFANKDDVVVKGLQRAFKEQALGFLYKDFFSGYDKLPKASKNFFKHEFYDVAKAMYSDIGKLKGKQVAASDMVKVIDRVSALLMPTNIDELYPVKNDCEGAMEKYHYTLEEAMDPNMYGCDPNKIIGVPFAGVPAISKMKSPMPLDLEGVVSLSSGGVAINAWKLGMDIGAEIKAFVPAEEAGLVPLEVDAHGMPTSGTSFAPFGRDALDAKNASFVRFANFFISDAFFDGYPKQNKHDRDYFTHQYYSGSKLTLLNFQQNRLKPRNEKGTAIDLSKNKNTLTLNLFGAITKPATYEQGVLPPEGMSDEMFKLIPLIPGVSSDRPTAWNV